MGEDASKYIALVEIVEMGAKNSKPNVPAAAPAGALRKNSNNNIVSPNNSVVNMKPNANMNQYPVNSGAANNMNFTKSMMQQSGGKKRTKKSRKSKKTRKNRRSN